MVRRVKGFYEFCFGILSLILATSVSFAGGGVDKSGLKPQVLKLPSGPGSINGLGESFEAQLNSGTASYSVPLALMPGRAGFLPDLALVYNGGYGNGPVGIGWRFSIAYIQRQTDKGLPVYDDQKDVFITEGGEELVSIGDNKYRCENETAFILFERSGSTWKAAHKNGSKSYFGSNSNERIENENHVFRWSISKKEDPNGNAIHYHYNEDIGFSEGVSPGDGQLYLTSIVYNQDNDFNPVREMRVEMKYETREPKDRLFDYRSRFPVQTSQRCKEIILFESGQRIRSYTLIYDSQTISSKLVRVELYGINPDEGALESILKFDYTGFELNSVTTPMNSGINPGVGLSLADVDLVDMNGDALPDLLHTGDVHEVFLNANGREWKIPYDVPGGFTEIKLRQANTMLMDMDGDGFSDLFSQDLSINGYRYFAGGQLNNGWNPIPIEMNNSPPFLFGDITKPVDLDNDGRTDVIWKPELSSEIACVFNLDGLGFSGVFSIDPPSSRAEFNFGPEAASALRLADMNGDGLQDFVLLNGEGQIWYYPGHGVTLDPSTPWAYEGWDNTARGAWAEGDSTAEGYRMADAPDSFDDPDFTEVSNFRKLRLLDINGDGTSDLVYVANNRLLAWLNMGGHAFSSSPYVVFPDANQIPSLSPETQIRLADMNANGTQDVVWNRQTGFSEIGHSDSTWVYLDLTKGFRPNLLTHIDNGLGQVTAITYKSTTEYLVADRANGREWIFQVPFPVNVVAQIDVSDGRDNTYIRQMTYHDAYYAGKEKEFRGFAAVEEEEAGDDSIPGLIKAYIFDTGAEQEALKGKPLALSARIVSGDVFYNENYIWGTRKLAEGIDNDEREVTFPYQQTKTRDVLEKGNGTPVQLKWEYEYDDYGNMTRQTEHGRMDPGWDDERVTETTFSAGYPSGPSNWILDRVIEKTIRDENDILAAHKRNYYDGNLVLGEVSKGNLTREEDWVSGNEYVVSTRKDYDSFGNVTAIYDPLYGAEPGHYRTLTYDDTFHTFPVKEEIHTGSLLLTMSATYDYGFGVMTSSTDFNGFTTHYGYDNFGRLVSIIKPPDTAHTTEYDYVLAHELGDGNVINWVETRQRDDSTGDGYLRSRIFYDGMGRKIMTRSEGEEPGQIVVSDTVQFNARKQPWKKYLPYFETGTLDFVEPTNNSGFTEYIHDATGREIRVYQPEGADGTVHSATIYEPLVKIVHDEEQTKDGSMHESCGKRFVEDGLWDKDGNGRLREVHEIVKLMDTGEKGPLTSWITTYSYNLLDNLTGYTDSRNNQKIMEYDGLGRKIFMNDPDRGHMTYAYDDAGNLIRTVDAKNQTIEYEYDGVNRLVAENYGLGNNEPDVAYHYDLPAGALERGDYWLDPLTKSIADVILTDGQYRDEYDRNNDSRVDVADLVMAKQNPDPTQNVTAENTKGFLAWVHDQAGEEHNSYDERGRVKWTVKRIIDGSPDELANFYTAMQYDSMDRITRLTYPDSTYADYTYNSRGLLESIPNVISTLDYNPAGQNALLELSCGIRTEYEYDHRLRLERLMSKRKKDDLTLQDLNYTYDAVSNITHIQDGRTNPELDTIGSEIGINAEEARKFNATQFFEYDSLYRLIQATNPAVYGTLIYRYDPIGNMIRKDADLVEPDPIMDLGAMTCGGTAGTYGRVGRNPGEPAGPHAITATEKGPEGGMAFQYDANGNVVSLQGITFTWDYKDRLSELNKASISAQYSYDYTGTRKKKTVSSSSDGSPKQSVYVNKFSEIRDGKFVKYAYAGENRIARSEKSPIQSEIIEPTTTYLHDHLGSTAIALDTIEYVKEQLANYPFGHPRQEIQVWARNPITDYKFTGKEKDEESEMYYFEARYLSGLLGRFLSVDLFYTEIDGLEGKKINNLLKNSQNLNLYQYVQNNAVNAIDPSGLAHIYSQSTGKLTRENFSSNPSNFETTGTALQINRTLVGTGYSGHGEGINNPEKQDVENVGPIPQGIYTIGEQKDHITSEGKTLIASMELTPDSNNEMHDREGFLMHGDNDKGNQSASKGCPIFDRATRDDVANSGDNELIVVP